MLLIFAKEAAPCASPFSLTTSPPGGLEAEWGLSLYLEYQGHALLLDTGASDLFARNAKALGLDLGAVAFGVLSHAHWDHANGMDAFFARNAAAPFYLRQGCGETCFDHFPGLWRYEGPRRLLARFASRIRYVEGVFLPLPGVTLLPPHHPRPGPKGAAAGMFRLEGGPVGPRRFLPRADPGAGHPPRPGPVQQLCHAGADTVVREVQAAFPGRPIRAIVGASTSTPPQTRRSGPGPPPPGHRGGAGPHRPLHRGAGVCPAPGGAGGDGGAVLHRAGGGTVRQTPHCVASVGGPVKPAQVETCDVVSPPLSGAGIQAFSMRTRVPWRG